MKRSPRDVFFLAYKPRQNKHGTDRDFKKKVV